MKSNQEESEYGLFGELFKGIAIVSGAIILVALLAAAVIGYIDHRNNEIVYKENYISVLYKYKHHKKYKVGSKCVKKYSGVHNGTSHFIDHYGKTLTFSSIYAIEKGCSIKVKRQWY